MKHHVLIHMCYKGHCQPVSLTYACVVQASICCVKHTSDPIGLRPSVQAWSRGSCAPWWRKRLMALSQVLTTWQHRPALCQMPPCMLCFICAPCYPAKRCVRVEARVLVTLLHCIPLAVSVRGMKCAQRLCALMPLHALTLKSGHCNVVHEMLVCYVEALPVWLVAFRACVRTTLTKLSLGSVDNAICTWKSRCRRSHWHNRGTQSR